MKYILVAAIAGLLTIGKAQATNEVVSQYAEIVSAMNPHQVSCAVGQDDYRDVVNSCHASAPVVSYAVAEPSHCSYNDLVRFVNNRRTKSIVRRNVLRDNGFTGYDQHVVVCVREVRVNGKLVRRNRFGRVRVFGRLVGRNARAVKVAVDSCR